MIKCLQESADPLGARCDLFCGVISGPYWVGLEIITPAKAAL